MLVTGAVPGAVSPAVVVPKMVRPMEEKRGTAKGIPQMALGLPCGSLVLSMAVLSIVVTAPLGALGMDLTAPRLLRDDAPQIPS